MSARAEDPASPSWRSPRRPRTRPSSCSAPARIPRASPPRQHAARRSTSTRCARPSRRSSSSTCCELHALQPRLQARPRGQGDRRQGGRAQRGPEEDHGLGEAPPLQHRPEGQVVVEHYRTHVAPLLGGTAKAMVVVGSRIEAVRWQLAVEKYIKEHGLPDRHAGGVLGRGRRQRVRPRPFHRAQPRAQPQAQGPRHPRGLQGARVPAAAGRPTSSRPASTSRCSAACTSTSGWRGSRPCRRSRGSTAPTPARTRPTSSTSSTTRRSAGRVQDLLHHRRALGDHRPEPGLRPAREARQRRPLRRLRGGSCRRRRARPEGQAERSGRRDRAGA
jgi:hypothetical protein